MSIAKSYEQVQPSTELQNLNQKPEAGACPSLDEIVTHELYSQKDFELEPVVPIEIMFKNLNIWAEMKDKKCGGTKSYKHILKGVSGTFGTGQCIALLGSSGSGKTTLINYLSSMMHGSKLKTNGELFINGTRMDSIDSIKHRTGFVEQIENLIPDFSPKELLTYTAKMAGIPNYSQKVREVLNILGLNNCQDTRVGSVLTRGISGGERKRTAIGLELINNPSFIFLDEPTTGLDSKSALDVAALLKRLSRSGRSIISTIHSPSFEILNEFDKVLCMSHGEIVYEGTPANIGPHFEALGLPMPAMTNPADHLMSIIHEDDFRLKAIRNEETFSEDDIQKKFKERITMFVKEYKSRTYEPSPVVDSPVPLPQVEVDDRKIKPITNYVIVAQRGIQFYIRNPTVLRTKVLQQVVFALMAIFLLNNTVDIEENTPQAIIDRGGMALNLSSSLCFGGFFATMYIFIPGLPTFRKENENKLYGPLTYYFTVSAFEIAFGIPLTLVYQTLVFWLINIRNDSFSIYLQTFVLLFVTRVSAQGLGDLMSLAIKNIEIINSMVPVIVVPLFLVCGFLAQVKTIPWHMRIFSYLSFFRFGFQGLVTIQFQDGEKQKYIDACAIDGTKIPNIQGICNPDTIFDFYETSLWLNIVILLILAVLYRVGAILAIFAFAKKVHLKNDPIPEELIDEVNSRKAVPFRDQKAPPATYDQVSQTKPVPNEEPDYTYSAVQVADPSKKSQRAASNNSEMNEASSNDKKLSEMRQKYSHEPVTVSMT